ncbi:hypothetical protein FOL47_000936 [Perkinsus chesapeaki]|uniref:TLDc domain-containing protein n=1 Tax=Perkinsus chesapeaki TaxID=330153 RepID=A0A7J6N0W4_PERCH|nr:hypothetical protein FOL47_000936 [Perkinsus chesapeaki]
MGNKASTESSAAHAAAAAASTRRNSSHALPDTDMSLLQSFFKSAESNGHVTPESFSNQLFIAYKPFAPALFDFITGGGKKSAKVEEMVQDAAELLANRSDWASLIQAFGTPHAVLQFVVASIDPNEPPRDIKIAENSAVFGHEFQTMLPGIGSVFNESLRCALRMNKRRMSISGGSEANPPSFVKEYHVLLLRIIYPDLVPPLSTLYWSSTHGRSLQRLMSNSGHYPGPTALIIKDTKGRVWGAATGSALDWSKDTIVPDNAATNGYDLFNKIAVTTTLFQLEPEIRVIRGRTRSSADNYVYLNARNKVRAKGLGFGGRSGGEGDCRVWINEDLNKASVMDYDATYDAGQILSAVGDDEEDTDSMRDSDICDIAVLGGGGPNALKMRAEEVERERQAKEDSRKVDMKRFMKVSEFDKETLLANTFGASNAGHAREAIREQRGDKEE